MKKKLLALVCALALTVSLVGCVFSTPDTVGKIGDFEVTSGLYLLAQYDAYQQAAQLAGSEQDASKVKSFLKATITTDADTGETAVVSDYVAQKTLETLQTLAAVDARFTELGGELTEEQKVFARRCRDEMRSVYEEMCVRLLQHEIMLERGMVPDVSTYRSVFCTEGGDAPWMLDRVG